MKKFFWGFLMTLLFCVPALAHAHPNPSITVTVDGEVLQFDQPPIIRDDRTLVPMRKIFEALDAEVFWDEPSQSVTAVSGKDVIVLYINQAGLYKNGELVYTMSVPAQIVNDRTLVPLRAIAESLGCTVAWDGIQYAIDITSGTPSYNGQATPTSGGYSYAVTAADGTIVLNAEIRCDEVTSGKAATINGYMANETYGQGEAFRQAYAERALAEYAADPEGFRPYYYMGTYYLTRECDGYASFLSSITSYDGEDESVMYFSHTYSLSTGAEVGLKDLVTDKQADLELLWEASFAAMIDADPDAFYANAESRLRKNLDKVDFYLTETGIVFYLPPEVIAPAETGAVSFEIKYQF